MNVPNWKEYDTWNEIKFFCENNKFTVGGFVYCGIKMTMSKNHEQITFVINNINHDIISIINDLPTNITELLICVDSALANQYLEKNLTNLPFGLKKIIIFYKNSNLPNMRNDESQANFNILFGVKIPFDCNFIVRYGAVDYQVNYIDYDKEIELKGHGNIFRIKYINESNLLLTGNPQLTFFKIAYRPHTNFSITSL